MYYLFYHSFVTKYERSTVQMVKSMPIYKLIKL